MKIFAPVTRREFLRQSTLVTLGLLPACVRPRPPSPVAPTLAATPVPTATRTPERHYGNASTVYAETLRSGTNSVESTNGGLLSNSIRTLTTATDGLWIGYAAESPNLQQTVGFYNGRQIERCASAEITPSGHVNFIAVDENTGIWIAVDGQGKSDAAGVYSYQIGKWWGMYRANDASKLPDNRAYWMAFDPNHQPMVALWEGIAQYNPNTNIWTPRSDLRIPENSNHIHTFLLLSDGRALVGTINQGLYIFNGKEWSQVSKRDIGSDSIRYLTLHPDGSSVWVATDGGGISSLDLNNNHWRTDLKNLDITSTTTVKIDRFGRPWATDYKTGTWYFDGIKWINFNHSPALTLAFGYGSNSLNENSVYIGTQNNGLSISDLP